jgi:hypothetical protein
MNHDLIQYVRRVLSAAEANGEREFSLLYGVVMQQIYKPQQCRCALYRCTISRSCLIAPTNANCCTIRFYNY